MGAVTYPNAEVQQFINDRFVPVQFNVKDHPDTPERFNSTWTPTFIVQDTDGREHRRAQGYHDPQRFLGELSLGWLMAAINRKEWRNASERLDEIARRTRGDLHREPE